MTDDRLRPLQERLDGIEALPLEERPQLFEQIHQALVAELNALEEV